MKEPRWLDAREAHLWQSYRDLYRELTGALTAVVITDSFGRAWRVGQCDVAIGCAGLAPVLLALNIERR